VGPKKWTLSRSHVPGAITRDNTKGGAKGLEAKIQDLLKGFKKKGNVWSRTRNLFYGRNGQSRTSICPPKKTNRVLKEKIRRSGGLRSTSDAAHDSDAKSFSTIKRQ